MKTEILRYTEDMRPLWESLLASSINGTFLHSRYFFDHNPMNAADDHSYLFLKKGKPVALFPAAVIDRDGVKILHSHPRATYGGFVVSKEIGVEEAVEIVEHVITEARELDVKEIIVRNPFRLFSKALCDETDYALWYHGFSIKSRELEVAIELGSKDIIESRYNDSTKRSIKKAEKAVSVIESEDFITYWRILEANLETRHGAKPTHNYEQFCSLLHCIGKDKIKLFAAIIDGNIIGGILVFIANSVTIHAQYIASDAKYQDYRPLNAVINHINFWGVENNFKYFNLGMANENHGRGINLGLFRFKEGFGGRCALRETMHCMLT